MFVNSKRINKRNKERSWIYRSTKFLYVLVALLVLGGCRITSEPATPNPNPEPEPINPIEQLYKQNLKKWQSQNLQSYEFVFQRICFCRREVTRPARVAVQNNDIESIRWIESYQEVETDNQNLFLSVDQIFDLIQSAIDRDAPTIRVEYDVDFGYPTSLYIDYNEMIADEELSIKASFLEAALDGVKPLPISCEAYSTDSYEYSVGAVADINFATLQVLSEATDSVKVCLRSQHNNGCVEAVEVSSSFASGEFNLIRNIVPIQPIMACTAMITPYAKLVELDVVGLEPGTYPINYFTSSDSPNPQVKTTFNLSASNFTRCLPNTVTEQTIVSAIMTTNDQGQNVIVKTTVLEKLQALKANCSNASNSMLMDENGKEIRFYQLIGCWGARPDDADEQLTQQAAEIESLKQDFTVVS